MSLKAFLWAGDQACRPSEKLILLALAQCHNISTPDLYPSVMWICEYSGLDRKTVLKAMHELRDQELIIDTGRTVGRGVIVYRLAFDATDEISGPKNGTGTSTKNGTANEGDLFGSGPVFPSDRSQKRDQYRSQKRDIEPVKGTSKGTGEDARPDAPGALGARPAARPRATRARERRASQLPRGFKPMLTEGAQKIVDQWPPGMLDSELDKFRDRHISKGSTFKDWQAAFRTWIRNANDWRNERGNHRNGSAKGSGSGDGFIDAIREHRDRTPPR